MKTIFIGGSQRSGTTLLNKFLCLDQYTNPKLAEASYLRELVSAYKTALQDFNHDTSSYFDSPQDLQVFHSSLINLFLTRTHNRHPEAHSLVLKEPHLTQYFPELFSLCPHSLFILIARDPRDIISSMISVGEKMQVQGQQHFFQQRNIEQLCQHVLSFYAPSLNFQHEGFKKRLFIMRYEDLILNTNELQKRLAEFCQLELAFNANQNPNNSMRIDNRAIDPNHPEQARYQAWITDNNAKHINASSIGAYKNIFKPGRDSSS